MPHKSKQSRLLPKLEPIKETDTLTIDALTTHYRCRCGNRFETGIRLEATHCGVEMKPVAEAVMG